ncbi:MAG: thioredoxin-disulfide reductase [Candidatus Izemoplasmatales bacterium]|nr:thioredoxin-disulfide reductase [Candidatus Izemoplasmatales bacterium]MDY0139833.1 thioredoxin-disulfide reductase [Candidatus Izemoplasmatales bacterium]
MEHVYDLVILGAGPAGLSAAIYAKRAMLDFVILEKWLPGGEIANTFEVENYLGVNRLSGMELANNMVKHAEDLGVKIISDPAENVDFSKDIKKIVTETNTYYTKTVIIASGASPRKLGVKGESRLSGLGVSYCATCDGFLYKNKVVAVVGGGDVAVEDAIYLSRMCSKVYLIHRRDELRAVKSLQERMFKLPNVEVKWNSIVEDITGENFVENVIIKNKETQVIENLAISGIFIGIGHSPNVDFLKDEVKLDEGSWIITDELLQTNIKGVYAAGDIRVKNLRQIVTAVSDGAIAVNEITKYL